MFLEYVVDNKYINLKEILKLEFGMSERLILKLKTNKRIYINNDISNINTKINLNDKIRIDFDFNEDNSNIIPKKMDLDIIYEDDYYIVLNKPAGIPVHPSKLYYDNSLSNGLKHYYDNISLKKKIRPVNRLDKDTSGIVIFAKNAYIQECLIKQMKCKKFIKKYIAICEGKFKNKNGTINLPIARKDNSIIERCINQSGDTAITHYNVLKTTNDLSVLECILETGRTHQIRVHLSSIGHPIISDTLYGNKSTLIGRQALHAYKVNFIHPIFKRDVIYSLSLPDDFKKICNKLSI